VFNVKFSIAHYVHSLGRVYNSSNYTFLSELTAVNVSRMTPDMTFIIYLIKS